MLRVRFERDLAAAARAADVEAVYGYGVVALFGRLLACVELAALVDVLAARSALHGEGRHQAHRDRFWSGILGAPRAGDFGGIEVGWVVFLEDFSFGHDGVCSSCDESKRRM